MDKQGGVGTWIGLGLIGVLLLVLVPVLLFTASQEDRPAVFTGCLPAGGDEGGIPAQYRPAVQDAAREAGLPVALIAAQIKAESDWNPQALSPAGAQGLAQFMPDTWAAYGIGDPFDPQASIAAQGRYMKELLEAVSSLATTEKERIDFALAAYNAGPTAVRNTPGIPPIPETQEYVQRINRLAQLDYSVDCVPLGGSEIGDLGTGEWTHPMPGGILTSRFGPRTCPVSLSLCMIYPDLLNHRGIDFGMGGAGIAVAPADMRITFTQREHESSLAAAYGDWIRGVQVESPHVIFEFHHCAAGTIAVHPGDTVAVGTPLCREGVTGNSSAPHIHFQINKPGTALDGSYQANHAVDPYPLLLQRGITP